MQFPFHYGHTYFADQFLNAECTEFLPQGSRRWVWMIAENNSNLICIKVNYI